MSTWVKMSNPYKNTKLQSLRAEHGTLYFFIWHYLFFVAHESPRSGFLHKDYDEPYNIKQLTALYNKEMFSPADVTSNGVTGVTLVTEDVMSHALGILVEYKLFDYHNELGYYVPDFDEYRSPEFNKKKDNTNAERQRRYRERKKLLEAGTLVPSVILDDSDVVDEPENSPEKPNEEQPDLADDSSNGVTGVTVTSRNGSNAPNKKKNKKKKEREKEPTRPTALADPLYSTALEILEYLNQEAKRELNTTSDHHLKAIIARLKKGNSVDEMKLVIAEKSREWKDHPTCYKNLNPTLLFGVKHWQRYLEEAVEAAHRRNNVVQFQRSSEEEEALRKAAERQRKIQEVREREALKKQEAAK